MKSVLMALALLSCGLSLGCDDFDSPAELKHNQILAVQSTPASIGLGESAELSVLVFRDDGSPIPSPDVRWSVAQPGAESMGEVSLQGDTATYTAPSALSESPAIVNIEVEVHVGDDVLHATKFLAVGGPTLPNPEITAITVDGEAVTDLAVLKAGSEISLGLETAAPLGESPSFAWYARPGQIDAYRSRDTSIVVPEETGEGWLVVVVRDLPGTASFAIPTRVE